MPLVFMTRGERESAIIEILSRRTEIACSQHLCGNRKVKFPDAEEALDRFSKETVHRSSGPHLRGLVVAVRDLPGVPSPPRLNCIGYHVGPGLNCMDWSRKSEVVIAVTLISCLAVADNKQQESAALIMRAKQLSDLRVEGSPAFRLKVSFKITEDNSTAQDGNYTEVWVSREQWWRETVLGDFRRTEVGKTYTRWTLNSSSTVPRGGGEIGPLMELGYSPDAWKPGQIQNRDAPGTTLRCIQTKPNPWGGKSALCFDTSSGLLAARIYPERLDRIVDYNCLFSDYQKFGDKMYPWSIRCLEDQQPRLEAKVVELTLDPTPDPALFEAPAGAIESSECHDRAKPPSPVYAPDPSSPQHASDRGTVVLWLVVGIDGKPHGIAVVRSINTYSDGAAIDAVRRWTFNPGTCDGRPIAVQISVEVAFQ
jgi:periplasmic protein TonB